MDIVILSYVFVLTMCNKMPQNPWFCLFFCDVSQHSRIPPGHRSITPLFHYSVTPGANWHGFLHTEWLKDTTMVPENGVSMLMRKIDKKNVLGGI